MSFCIFALLARLDWEASAHQLMRPEINERDLDRPATPVALALLADGSPRR